jgi:hypothetical protein
MRIFNRQNDLQQYLADQQGYTQGIGFSYEVDFNTSKELFHEIFGKSRAAKNKTSQVPDSTVVRPPEESAIENDSLIRFYSKKQKSF